MTNERRINTSHEVVQPEDFLPTAKFLSRLSGLDIEYPKFIGGSVALWKGVGNFDGQHTQVTIGHVDGETSFFIETRGKAERWEVKERSCDVVNIRQSFQVVQGTLLNSENLIRLKDTHWASISFCRGLKDMEGRGGYYCCSDCYLLQPSSKSIANPKNAANKPSEFPIRLISQVNKEASRVEGFRTVDEAITALVNLRNLVTSLEEIPVDTGPMPPGQSLVSEAYFPA